MSTKENFQSWQIKKIINTERKLKRNTLKKLEGSSIFFEEDRKET